MVSGETLTLTLALCFATSPCGSFSKQKRAVLLEAYIKIIWIVSCRQVRRHWRRWSRQHISHDVSKTTLQIITCWISFVWNEHIIHLWRSSHCFVVKFVFTWGETWSGNRCGSEGPRHCGTNCWTADIKLSSDNSGFRCSANLQLLCSHWLNVWLVRSTSTLRVHVKRTSEHPQAKFYQPDTLEESVW